MSIKEMSYADLKEMRLDLVKIRESLRTQSESLYGICESALKSVDNFYENPIHDKIKMVDKEIKLRKDFLNEEN